MSVATTARPLPSASRIEKVGSPPSARLVANNMSAAA
jgi:hypothetical protein